MTVRPNKKLLLFAYFYPPLGGPAVQRPCKTVKYLSQMGWETDVITIRDIVYHSRDESLLAECSHKRIFRTASLDPMYLLNKLKMLLSIDTTNLYFRTGISSRSRVKKLFLIDDKIGWLPFAYKAGIQALLTNQYQAVMVTCSPFSSALAAYFVARKAKLPLILDYRDHWTLNNTTEQPHGLLFKLIQALERNLLNAATLVLTATNMMKPDITAQFGLSLSNKIMPYFNGWDEADFVGKEMCRIPDNVIRIAYLGTLYGDRPLTYLLQALKQIQQENLTGKIEFWMVGNYYPSIVDELNNCGLKDNIIMVEQQPHSKAIQIMLDSDILLLIIGDEKNKWVLTGKLFEYLRCQKPILALTSRQSEAAEILQNCGHTTICDIRNAAEIKDNISAILSAIDKHESVYKIPYEYERSNQVRNLANRLSNL